jgi:hypothetical protein
MRQFPLTLLLITLVMLRASGQAPNGAWVYPSATGNLLYQLDSRGQRITDFSQCGYRGGTEPLPNVTALIPQSRWVSVSPGTGDDTALIQAAIDAVEAMTPDANGWRGVVFLNAGEYQLATTITINASGVVLKGAGDSPTSTGTRLRATDKRQYTLISATNSSTRSTVAGTTHDLTQKLVPAGARTFEVDSTSGLAVGHTVLVKRPSTANWIADIDMDQLGAASGDPAAYPWTAGSRDLSFDRTITRIDGNWITVDIPLPQTFEAVYGGGQIWRYTWSGRLQQVGIEDIYGVSDYSGSTDEDHGWYFITMRNVQNGWVRNITSQYFGYSAVTIDDGSKWVTVADSQCLDPISIIDGGRRYSFNNDGGQCILFVNNYARKGRHDFVFGSGVPGPNVFVHGTADTVYADSGPHHRWSVGALFDEITINGNELNVENRGNLGSGHGWTGAYMTVWNCDADTFRVRNPPTARNWLVGSIGTIGTTSNYPIGADPAGTYDSSGPSGTGKAVYPRSLYYGQLQQRMKWLDSEFREDWLGDVDQLASTTFGDPVNCDAAWLASVEALDALPAFAKFDYLAGGRYIACTLDFQLDPGDTVVAASLTVSVRAVGSAAADKIWLDSATSPQTYSSLGWTPISTTAQTVRTMEVSPALLTDGRLNVALGTNSAVDFVVLHLQVQKAQPLTYTVTLNPVADTYVMGGINVSTNYGTATTLVTKDDTNPDFDRETFLRWDLSGVSGKVVQAKVRLAGTTTGQAGNESCATFVSSDTWSEATTTYGNKPTAGKLFAQWLPVAGQPVEFTVTPRVVETMLGDGKLSLSLLSTGAYGAAGTVSYASRENTTEANRPQLILTMANAAPTIASPADQSILKNSATGALAFTVGDDFTAAASLTVTNASSNPTLVPAANIVLGGSGATRTVTVTPAANQTGSAIITLTVSDGAFTTSDTFLLTVLNLTTPVTLSVPIAVSADDAEESAAGVVTLTSTDLELVDDGGLQTVGLRFAGLNIPQGAIISSATIQFKADEVHSEATTLDITVQAADSAPAFITTTGNLSNRATTSTSVLWQPPAWNTIGEATASQRTSNLAAVVQEIVSRPGWASGNAIAFLVEGTGHRTAEAFDKVGGVPASLSVTFSTESAASFTQWMTAYPTLTGNNTLSTANPDRDAFNNLLEYALATNPTQSNSAPYSVTRQGNALVFTYTRPSLAPDLTYAVEWSQTLTAGTWSTAGVTQQITSDNGTVRTVKASVPAGGAKLFLHLRVTTL